MFIGLTGWRARCAPVRATKLRLPAARSRAAGPGERTRRRAVPAQLNPGRQPVSQELRPRGAPRTRHRISRAPGPYRPQDFEVYGIEKVTGIVRDGGGNFPVAPFYSAAHRSAANEDRAYYTIQRRPRLASMRQTRTGERTGYLGSECFISVADSRNAREGHSTPG